MDNDRYFNRSSLKSYIRLLPVEQRLLTCNLTVLREEQSLIKKLQNVGNQSSLTSMRMLTVRLSSVNDEFSGNISRLNRGDQSPCTSASL